MLALYILLGLLGALVLLILLVLFVPMYARIVYDGALRVNIRVLGVPMTLLPSEDEPSEDKPHPDKQKKRKKPSKTKELLGEMSRSFKEDGVVATLDYLTRIAKLVGQAVERVLHSITVDKMQLELRIADQDAATTAIRYGQVCGVLYPALTAIVGVVKVRKRMWRIEPNYLTEQSKLNADVQLHVWGYRLLAAAIVLLVRYMLLTMTDKEETNHGK